MQRMVLLAVLAALTALGGCAQRDPNLVVPGLNEFGRSAGDYTLSLKTYDLDAEGRARMAGTGDASLSGFVNRALQAKGYTQKASGPARYGLEVHLLCADTRNAELGFMGERLRLPAQAVGAGYSEEVHFWLPEKGQGLGQPGQESQDRLEAMQNTRGTGTGNLGRPNQSSPSGAPLGRTQADHCQGRVLMVLTPAANGPLREVFVGRLATQDCPAVSGCPVGACRTALEHSLVDLLERGF